MKKLSKNLAICICMFVAVFCAMTLKAEAANVTSGTLGDNDGITWIYDADTKTLTITGEDTGVDGSSSLSQSIFVSKNICPDVEKIKVKDCKLYRCYYLFAGMKKLKTITFENFDTSEVTTMVGMFRGCESLTDLDLSSFDTSQVKSMYDMFYKCTSLRSLNLSSFDTSNVTSMLFMFRDCGRLGSLDVSGFDTSKVANMSNMFSGCYNLKSLDVSGFDTSKVTSMQAMFAYCGNLESLDLSGFNTSKVSSMGNMFYSCYDLKSLDLSSFDTSGVTDTSWMFADCYSLTSLDLSSFDTSKVKKMGHMFSRCSSLKSIDLSGIDTSQVTKMSKMFVGCSSLESLDLSSFDTSQVTDMENMFQDCNALGIIYTFKGMNETGTVDLPGTFADLNQNQTTVLNKNFCKTILINVSNLVAGINVAPTSAKIKPGDVKQLQATVAPANAAIKEVLWKSSNTAVATVDAIGKVTAVGEGTATITATAKDGTGISATCEVTVVDPVAEQKRQVRTFVERMYTIVLGRAAEEQGLNDWTARLMAKEIDGATLVDMFVNSDEFINRNTSDEEYIKILYRAVLGREADEGGLKMWKDMLADDWTRDYILDGLVLSTEFKNICDSYGIIAAFEPTAESQVRSFVKRMYTVVLNRRADAAGLNDWTEHLMNGTANGAQLADGFISSDEFVNRNLSNEKYVKVLYRAFFNREPDEGGFSVWMNELAKGASRRDVMKGFVHSVEFSDLCASYGIIRGEIQ